MIEHCYEYLPAAWFTPEGRWYVLVSVMLLMAIAFVAGYCWEERKDNSRSHCMVLRVGQSSKTFFLHN